LTDHLVSTRAVIDNSGTVQDSIVYDGYGNITYQTPSPTTSPLYTYTGRELDVETGLQFNRSRYYDAGTARWISQDPMGFDAGDSNLCRYVNNRPTDAMGPSGLDRYIFDSTASPYHSYVIIDNWYQNKNTGLWRKNGVIRIDFSIMYPSPKTMKESPTISYDENQ
jgi:RHS repeat-associated protein